MGAGAEVLLDKPHTIEDGADAIRQNKKKTHWGRLVKAIIGGIALGAGGYGLIKVINPALLSALGLSVSKGVPKLIESVGSLFAGGATAEGGGAGTEPDLAAANAGSSSTNSEQFKEEAADLSGKGIGPEASEDSVRMVTKEDRR